ncbi:hypothetical protein [Vibrio cyclitrophicus]|uniref:hypothetical protein n=1 Tax=Vibrio cyclitrophicus TaxID=47951 RepID=UPI000C832CAF|nr:hypothetical protein [Vibrio cyclitrophicus]PMN19485.1 hypothetical protein BCT37_19930 [Vibrio cyclitrophicus]
MTYKFDPRELTQEKSLWDIYKKAFLIFPSKLQIIMVFLVALGLGINAYFFEENTSILVSDIRIWASLGFNYAITTLGFLIAGFTIFATLTKPDMMLAMMEHPNKRYKLPTLKYNFFVFIKVFVSYIFFSIVYVLIILLGQENGFISHIIDLLPYSIQIKQIIVKTSYIIIGCSFIHLIMQLKSFIFNIYMIVMNMLRWEHLVSMKKTKNQ